MAKSPSPPPSGPSPSGAKPKIELADEVISRYKRLIYFNGGKKQWSKQTLPGYEKQDFPRMAFPISGKALDAMLDRMLRHKLWLGSVAPANGYVDRIAFDLDCKTPDQRAARDDRYMRLRAALGDRRPLVYATPSGLGLRVVYRIPAVRIDSVVTGLTSGLVADVLRGQGVSVVDGQIEVYPQRLRPDRLPLGRRMPLLDPDTLAPLPHAAIGDKFDLEALLGALTTMEEWDARPDATLLPYLNSLPRREAVKAVAEAPSIRASVPAESEAPAEAPLIADDLATRGLTQFGTRSTAEWRVGMAIATDPKAFGLPAEPSRTEVGVRLAQWLRDHNHGYSREWNASLVAHDNDPNAACAWWADKYLAPDGLVDKLLLAASKHDPGLRRVAALSESELRWCVQLASEHYTGSLRYRCAVWLAAWLLAVKRIINKQRRQDQTRTTTIKRHSGQSIPAAIVQIASTQMRSWPYGSGEDRTTGRVRYKEFVNLLRDEKLMILHTPYRAPNMLGGDWGEAAHYTVAVPDMDVRMRDVEVHPKDLRAALDCLADGDEPMSLAEAYMVLFLTRRTQRTTLVQWFKRDTTDRRILPLANAIRATLQAMQEQQK